MLTQQSSETLEKFPYLTYLPLTAEADVEQLLQKEIAYGGSWIKRGGIGAFMMLARKWDRIETQVSGTAGVDKYDIVGAILKNPDPGGILDDIGDLRRYLALVEAYAHTKLHGPSSAGAEILKAGEWEERPAHAATHSLPWQIAERAKVSAGGDSQSDPVDGMAHPRGFDASIDAEPNSK